MSVTRTARDGARWHLDVFPDGHVNAIRLGELIGRMPSGALVYTTVSDPRSGYRKNLGAAARSLKLTREGE